MRIELYLDSEEYSTGKGVRPSLRQVGGVPAADYEDGIHSNQRFTEIPENTVRLREMLERVAEKHGAELVVYDRMRVSDSVRAFFMGVRKIPTVIVGRRRFTGNITEEQIVGALKMT